jgi:predicted AlkP superfamily phosphohydrolase/phosphomutase
MQRGDGDRFPDLILEWNRAHPVEAVWSPRAGVVHVPYDLNRRGDHYEHGMLVAVGPSFPGAVRLPDVDIIDLTPTLCALLGVEMPDVDGQPVPELAGRSATGSAPGAPTPSP